MARGSKRSIVEEIAGECIAVRLRVLHRAITRLYNDALRPLGLTISQMNILVAVTRLKSASQGAVCRALHLEKSTLSRDLTRMKAQGWIRESGESQDARVRLLEITDAGLRLLERAYPAWQQAQGEARGLMGNWQVDAAARKVTGMPRANK